MSSKNRVRPGRAACALCLRRRLRWRSRRRAVTRRRTRRSRSSRSRSRRVSATSRCIDVPISHLGRDRGHDVAQRQLRSVADIAPTVPGLNVNSDSVGRAFVSIRGIGTALQAGVQPGVGVFQDGIYVPPRRTSTTRRSTSQRIEVLRGPQGTLYGKNTLGGAINIITRPPGETFEGKVFERATPTDDNGQEFGGRISGPLGDSVRAKARVRASRELGRLLREQADRRRRRRRRAATRRTARSCGTRPTTCAEPERLLPRLHRRLDELQPRERPDRLSRQRAHERDRPARTFKYKGGNAKRRTCRSPRSNTNVTAIGAYDARDVGRVSDGDFLPLDIVRSSGDGKRRDVHRRAALRHAVCE